MDREETRTKRKKKRTKAEPFLGNTAAGETATKGVETITRFRTATSNSTRQSDDPELHRSMKEQEKPMGTEQELQKRAHFRTIGG
jgi:hypothetical protein